MTLTPTFQRLSLLLVAFLCTACVAEQPYRPPVPEWKGPELSEGEQQDTDCSYFYFLWGKTAEAENRLGEALEAYEKAFVCDENADFIIKRLVLILIKMDRKFQAIDWLEKVVEGRPANRNARLLLSNLYASTADYDKAAGVYEAMILANPADREARLLLGSLYLSQLNYGKAKLTLEELVRVEPEYQQGWQQLAKLYRELHMLDNALSALHKALELNWHNSLVMEMGNIYEDQERWQEAADLYHRGLQTDYANEGMAARLVRAYLELDQEEEALAAYRQTRRFATDEHTYEYSMGRIFLEQTRYDAAIEIFSRLINEGTDYEGVTYMLASAYYEKGAKGEAARVLAAIPAESDHYEEAVGLRINILKEEKRYAEAIGLLEEIIETMRQRRVDARYYGLLGQLYKESGRMVRAHAVFRDAIADNPDEADIYFEYGMFLERAELQDQALLQMSKVLELEPENPYALNYIGYTWADLGRNLEEALEYISKAVYYKPKDGYIRDSLGWVYFKMGETDKAIRELELAITLQSDDPTIREHLGDAYLHGGRKTDALESYKRSLELLKEEGDEGEAVAMERVQHKIEALQ